MRFAALPLAILLAVVAAGCGHDDDRPVRVTVQNPPPAPAPPPTVIVHDHQNVGAPPPVTTTTPAAPPSDGARYRVDDVEVIYSEPLRAYTVHGYNDYYYLNGHFYRYDRGRWEYSPHMHRDARWVLVDSRDVPDTLVIRYRR